MSEPRPKDYLVSFVLPVFNEANAIEALVESIRSAMATVGCRYEMVFVNDGSSDASADKLDGLAKQDRGVRVVHFSRNFGHQPAVQAGLEYAYGDAVVVMDSD